MSTWKINLKEQTATSINGITFKLTETKPGEYEGVCLYPKNIPPDDLDDVITPTFGYKLFPTPSKTIDIAALTISRSHAPPSTPLPVTESIS